MRVTAHLTTADGQRVTSVEAMMDRDQIPSTLPLRPENEGVGVVCGLV